MPRPASGAAARAAQSAADPAVTLVTTYRGSFRDAGAAGGVATYAAQLATALRDAGCACDVAADVTGEPERAPLPPYVRRAWRRGDVGSVLRVLLRARGVAHVQHELFLYGGPLVALGLPVAFALARLRGRRVVTTVHGVVELARADRGFARRHGLQRLPPAAVRAALRFAIGGVARMSSAVLVHDDVFGARLVREYGVAARKVRTIPFVPYDAAPLEPREAAAAALGVPPGRTVAFFGYVTAYKGLAELLDAWAVLGADPASSELRLVIAAGPHPGKLDDAEYLRSYAALRERALALPRTSWLGFVPSEDLGRLFACVDLLVLPYRDLLSASGPLNLAIGYGVPVLCSAVMRAGVAPGIPCAELEPAALAAAIRDYPWASATAVVRALAAASSPAAVAAAHRAVYREVAGSRRRARPAAAP